MTEQTRGARIRNGETEWIDLDESNPRAPMFTFAPDGVTVSTSDVAVYLTTSQVRDLHTAFSAWLTTQPRRKS